MSNRQHLRWLVVLMIGVFPIHAAPSQTVKSILDVSPKRGICVIVGADAPELPVKVARASELIVYAQFLSAEEVQTARQAAAKAGLLGSRVYVEQGSAASLYLADDLADAVVVSNKAAVGKKVRAEVLRVLHPGAVAKIGKQQLTKPMPKHTDEWTHPYHGPDNNPQSTDRVARGPFLTHFMSEPWYAAMPQMSVISGGRIIKVWGNRTSRQPQWPVVNTMMAISAYNGTKLWTRKVPEGFMLHRSTLIATPDTIYFGDNKSCKVIDAATGKVRDEIEVPADITKEKVWDWMALEDGILYALVGGKESSVQVVKTGGFRGAGWPWWRYKNFDFGFGRTLLAIDVKTKKVLWHHQEKEPLDSRAMCMATGKIYFYSMQKFLGCLDAKTGKVVWKTTEPAVLNAISADGRAQNPRFGYITTAYVKCSDKALYFAGPMRPNIVGVSAKNGKLLWVHPKLGNAQLVLRDDALYALGAGRQNKVASLKIHPTSGKILAKFPGRVACTRATGCVDAIFTRGGRGGSTSVFNVTSNEPRVGLISPMRPACQDGVTMAHGYFFWGPWMCRCDYTQIGVLALGSAGDFDFRGRDTLLERLERNPNAAKVAPFKITTSDWPTFRHNNARGTRTDHNTPAKVARKWTFQPRGQNVATSPVAAGGLVFFAGSDGTVRAVDAKTGQRKWTAYTGGQIKYPPTIAKGRVYVGSGDGYIYCLEATSGRQVWRFRGAPVERRIPVFGSLISTWPIGSGVLVEKGIVYAAAGNANYNGTYVYALDAITGKIHWLNHTSGHKVTANNSGAGVQGHLLLHNKKLFMYGGNLSQIMSYDITDGTAQRAGGGNGKDLYVLGNRVNAGGMPLYFRPDDSHLIEKVGIPTEEGIVAVYTANRATRQTQVALAKRGPGGKLKSIWSQRPFQENNAVVVTKNAVIIAGLDRKGQGNKTVTTAGICALSLKTGTIMWRHALPANPVSWGVALDREGRILVSLQDGQVVCFGPKN